MSLAGWGILSGDRLDAGGGGLLASVDGAVVVF